LLTELKNEAELASVLGHEIIHAAARHGAKGMERGILLQGCSICPGPDTTRAPQSACRRPL
jgi:predicted Zn-dependent protease